MSDKLTRSLGQLNDALAALNEARRRDPAGDRLLIDGTIQRFEFTFELFWKTLKLLLADRGETVTFPKEALRAAYRAGWIDDEATWLAMLSDRNLSSHTYNEALADEIYDRINDYAAIISKAFETVRAL